MDPNHQHFLRVVTASKAPGVEELCANFLDDDGQSSAAEDFSGGTSETEVDSEGGSPTGVKMPSEMYVSPPGSVVSDAESLNSRSQLLNGSFQSGGTISPTGSPAPMESHAMREKMLQFYRKHNPDKVDKVDRLLEKYKNNLDDMFEALHNKYGVPLPEDGDTDMEHQAGEIELSREIDALADVQDAAPSPRIVLTPDLKARGTTQYSCAYCPSSSGI